jgi:hypothetical protein
MDWIVYALAVYDNKLIAGGGFTTAGGVDANSIASWDGFSWSALGSGMNNNVNALAVYDNKLIAGGAFTTAGGVSANYIASWDGYSWSPLGSGMDGWVSALAVYDNKLIAGGGFTTAGGVDANSIASWDGSSWSPLGSGMEGDYPYVIALAVYDNKLIAGGAFTTAGGVSANRIASWDGSSWSPLGSGMNGYAVYALAVYDNKLIAGGTFITAGGVSANNIASWDGSSWSPLGSGMNDYVLALAVYDNKLIAGGEFTTAGGKVSAYIAQWTKHGENQPPAVAMYAPSTAQVGICAQFDATPSYDPDGTIISYEWKWFWGDTWHNEGPTPCHVFTQMAYEIVTLRVTDNGGLQSTLAVQVHVVDLNYGLLAYWSFDDGTAHDNSGNDHNGIMIGTPTVINNGPLGKALMFDGKDDWIYLNDPVLTSQYDDYTICAWVKPHSIRSGKGHLIIDNGWLYLFTRSEYDQDENMMDNFWHFELSSGVEAQISGAGVCKDGVNYGLGCGGVGECPGGECKLNMLPQWTFVCGTYDASTNVAKLYINGQLAASGSRDQIQYIYELHIGGCETICLIDQFFKGALDEIRLYGRILPDDEIAFLYKYPDGNVAPLAELVKVSPPALKVGESVEFFGYAEDPDGSISHYYWDFNGDNVADLMTESPHATYQFFTAGSHEVGFWVQDDKGKSSLPAYDHVFVAPTNATVYLPPYAHLDTLCYYSPVDPPCGYCRYSGNPAAGNIGALIGIAPGILAIGSSELGLLIDLPGSVRQNIQVDAEIISSGGKEPFNAGVGLAFGKTYSTMQRYGDGYWQDPKYEDEIDPLLDADAIADVLDFVLNILIPLPDWPWGVIQDLGDIITNLASISETGELDIALKAGDREVSDITHSFVCNPGDRLSVGLGGYGISILMATVRAGRMGEVRYIVVQEIPTLPKELVITAYCPVDIVVTDPSGRTVNKDSTAIPGATYVWGDMNRDSSIDVQVYIPDALDGAYEIGVVADSAADSAATFSLRAYYKGETTTLAQDVPVANIPSEPYVFETYTCGDANGDGVINVTDVVYLINYLFISGPAPDPIQAGDVNCDGMVNVSDVVYLINYLFISGPPPSC